MDTASPLRSGLLLGATLITYFLITNFLRVSGEEWAGWLTYIWYVPFLWIALNHEIKLSKKIINGLYISFLGALTSSILMYLYLRFVDDLMIRTAIQNSIAQLAEDADERALQIRQIQSSITPMFYLVFGVISGTLLGSVLGLVIALITRKSAGQ